jgi:hypothetical protein
MRLRYAVAIFSLLVPLCRAVSPQATPQLGVTADNTRFNNDMSAAFVRVVNNSQKDVTGFTLLIDLTFKNGHHTHFEQTRDLLPVMTSNQENSGSSAIREGGLAPGKSQEIRVDVGQKDVLSINAVVNAVVYLDLSSEGDPAALARITSDRREWAATLEEGAAVVSDAVANGVTTDPAGLALKRIKDLLASTSSVQGSGMRALTLKMMIADIQSKSTRGDLKSYALHKNQEAQHGFEHSKIRGPN